MFYTVYKITNKLNGKYYIGKHQTNNLDDGYMGSGKLITRAIKKYGIDNFTKEILFVFDTEDEMNIKEAELVVVSEETYNLCDGGKGGWSYVNREGLNNKEELKEQRHAKIALKLKGRKCPEISLRLKKEHKSGKRIAIDPYAFGGKRHTELTKQRISDAMKEKQRGSKNSQYGTMWISNGIENCKIKKDDIIPEGWYKGRISKNG